MIEFQVGKVNVGGFKILDDEPISLGLIHCDVQFYVEFEGKKVYYRAGELKTITENPMHSIFAVIKAFTDYGLKFKSTGEVLDYFKVENQDMVNFVRIAENQGIAMCKEKILKYYDQYDYNFDFCEQETKICKNTDKEEGVRKATDEYTKTIGDK